MSKIFRIKKVNNKQNINSNHPNKHKNSDHNNNNTLNTLSNNHTSNTTYIYKNTWSTSEDNKLLLIVSSLLKLSTISNQLDWTHIASYFKTKNYTQCYSRYNRINPAISKGKWTIREDNIILNGVKEHGLQWHQIKLALNRSSKQIRDRYLNCINPNLSKSDFTVKEDMIITNGYIKYGKKWVIITSLLKNRSVNMVKNRFNNSLYKKYIKSGIIKDTNNNNSSNTSDSTGTESESTNNPSYYNNSSNIIDNNTSDISNNSCFITNFIDNNNNNNTDNTYNPDLDIINTNHSLYSIFNNIDNLYDINVDSNLDSILSENKYNSHDSILTITDGNTNNNNNTSENSLLMQ